jgi:hypothetical protein
MLVREELRSEMMRLNHVSRRDELGRRLVARGRLDAADDVFRLTFDELARVLLDEGFDARGAVARERARLAAWSRAEVPNRFASEEAGLVQARGVDQGAGGRGAARPRGEPRRGRGGRRACSPRRQTRGR